MTKNIITVHCPICKHDHETEAVRLVNVAGNEELKKKLDSGEIFEYTCPDCGSFMHLNYSFMYQDTDIREYIYLSEEKPEEGKYSFDQIAKNAMALAEGNTSDALLRVVYSEADLREKIRIFENGLDDRIVEIVKGIALSQFPSTEEFFVTDIRYDNIGGQELLRLICSDGTEEYVLEFNQIYNEIYDKYGNLFPPIRNSVFSCIDLEFAAGFLREADAME